MIASLFREQPRSVACRTLVPTAGCAWWRNGAWAGCWAGDEAEVVGQKAIDLIHKEDAPGVGERVKALSAGGVSEGQVRLRRRDGGYRWFAGRTQRMPNGDCIVTMRDATEERAHADELEETRRLRRELSESAGLGTWLYDPLEDRIEWSPDWHVAAYRFPASAEGHHSRAILRPRPSADVENTRRLMTHAVETNEGATGTPRRSRRPLDMGHLPHPAPKPGDVRAEGHLRGDHRTRQGPRLDPAAASSR